MADSKEQLIASFSFDHEYHGAKHELNVSFNITDQSKSLARISIADLEGVEVGAIYGGLKYEYYENVFYTDLLLNLQRKKDVTQIRIPRVVGATVAQLLIRGDIDTWYSSSLLLDPATDLYRNYLRLNPHLIIQDPSPNNGFRFVVNKKVPT